MSYSLKKETIVIFFLIIFRSIISCDNITSSNKPLDNFNNTIPSNIYAVTGINTEFFFKNTVVDSLEYNISSQFGEKINREWIFSSQESLHGIFDLHISFLDKTNTKRSILTELHISSGKVKQNDSLSLLFIGDSITQNGEYIIEINNLLNNSGIKNTTFLGSIEANDSLYHEGYRGKTWKWFTHNSKSPFIYNNELNFLEYSKDFCENKKPNIIIIMLGINDCYSVTPDLKDIDKRINNIFLESKLFLNKIKDQLPKTKIGICLTIPGNSRKESYINYPPLTKNRWKKIQQRLVQRYIQQFEKRENENIYLIPTHIYLDPIEGFSQDPLHPNTKGYKQIGKGVFSWIMWQISSP